MKEDILEQLVDDYLQTLGYFTRHNIKFRPQSDHPDFIRNQDSNHSDIDVLGYNPLLQEPERVIAVSCKSWQSGFDVRAKLLEIKDNKIRSGREAWKGFRELVQPKWSEAFIRVVQEITGCSEFTYVTAVTSVRGDRSLWERHPPFLKALRNNPIRLISLKDMMAEILPQLNTTVAASQFGRTLQLLKASGWKIDM